MPLQSSIAPHAPVANLATARVLKVQVAGDYREAYERMAHGGAENYYAQKYSIESDALLGTRVQQMSVLCCRTPDAYDTVLPNGVRAIGAGLADYGTGEDLFPLFEEFAPTHLIVAAAVPTWLQWALKRNIKVLPFFATSFSPTFGSVSFVRRLAKRWRHARWRNGVIDLLKHPQIPWVANHNMSSSIALHRLGLPSTKIVPWDWPAVVSPDTYPAKFHPGPNHPWKLTYVGVVSEPKGAGDLLDAVNKLITDGKNISLQVIGTGNAETLASLANRVKHLSDRVIFRGRIAHASAVAAIRDADIMIVPSRHDYPEGLPCTIQETLAVRTPLVCSNHPMFINNVSHEHSALIFKERNSPDLAAAISRLMDNPDLYNHMSIAGEEAWNKVQVATKYRELTHSWVESPGPDNQWLQQRSLATYPARSLT